MHPAGTSGGHVEQAVLDTAAALVELLHDSESGHCDRADLERLVAERPAWGIGFHGRSGAARITVEPGGSELELHGSRPDRYDFVRVHRHPEGVGPAGRRSAFSELYDAVRGSIGNPTVGGGPEGPDVRWRSESRTLRLRGDRQGFVLECRPTAEWTRRSCGFSGAMAVRFRTRAPPASRSCPTPGSCTVARPASGTIQSFWAAGSPSA